MRIERLDLAPYGRFADRSLQLAPDAHLHVVLGANESGKTTTLEAIGDLLYGVRDRTPYAFAYDYKHLRIGGALRLADGSLLELRRRKGDKNTLLDAEGKSLSEEALRSALGGIDRKAFETEFGLSQRALREGGEALLRTGGSLAETLAAGSASLSALNGARQRLKAEEEALFSPRRSASKPFYVALDAHTAAETKLRDAVVTADAMKSAGQALLEAQAREVDLKARHEEAGRAVARRRRALRVKSKLARLDAIDRDLAALADLAPLGRAALEAARKSAEADRAKRDQLDRLAADDARDAAARAALGLDAALLLEGGAIDALTHDLGAVRKAEEDLPRRLGEQVQARAQLDEIGRRLGLEGHAAAIAGAPSDAARARAKKLIEARARGRERKADAADRRRTAQAEQSRLGAAGAEALDPGPLKRRLDGFADALAEAERWGREQAQAAREAQALAEEAAGLDPASDLDALARSPLPDEAALEAAVRAEQGADDALRAAELALTAARRAVEASEAELRRRESGGPSATRADWEASRLRREAALDTLEAALDGAAAPRRNHFVQARQLVAAADAIAERVLADAARAARLQGAREELADKRVEETRRAADATAAAAALAGARANARALWATSGVAPREAAAMARWRARVAGLLARRTAMESRRAELSALAQRLEAARASLAGWFTEAGQVAARGDGFAELHRAARARLETLQAQWDAARERKIAAEQSAKTIAEADALLERLNAADANLAAEWPEAMQALRLRSEAGAEEAQAALAAWDALPLPREKSDELGHRIDAMQADVARFEREVAAVAAAAAPALAGFRARDALPRLTAALAAARRAADEDARLGRAATERHAVRVGLEAERAALGGELLRIRALLGAADDAALAESLDRLERRRGFEEERDALRRDLGETGDGLEEAELRQEAAGFDLGALPSDIEAAEAEQGRLFDDIRGAAEARSAAQSRRDALAAGRNATQAARERVEAAGELVDVAERWLVRAAAAKLAGRAIERHRAAAQDPLIARAGELFALATAGGFAGLGVGYGEDDQPMLVARRGSGETVELKGLSEGARDQLFLSLRLALLERRAGAAPPFVGDDLLASFDDERTRRTLELLAEFGVRRQTILFTHHTRVAELAGALSNRAIEVVEI